MFKTIWSYFGGKKEDISLDDAYNILAENNVEEEEVKETDSTEKSAYSCTEKIGKITSTSDNLHVIDEKYSFVSVESYSLNTKVSFVVHYDELNNANVTNVREVDDWTAEDTKQSTWHIRSLVSKVAGRDGRNLILTPHNIVIDLDNCSTNFVPIIGDYLTVEAKCMIDEDVTDLTGKILDIIKISPLRSQVLTGTIRHWNSDKGEGIINQDIHFTTESLVFGYRPEIKDAVTTEIIESSQNKCNWRSLNVVPSNENITKSLNGIKFNKIQPKVQVNKVVFLNVRSLKTPVTFEIYLENESDEDVKLLKIQCLTENILKPVKVMENFTIPANEKVAVEFTFEVKNTLNTFNIIKYVFDDFELLTNIFMKPHREVSKVSRIEKANYDLVKGQKVKASPRFIQIRLPTYQVPRKLFNLIRDSGNNKRAHALLCKEIVETKPCLSLPLTFNIYEDKYHTLLHLHEIRLLMDIEQYNKDQACFIRDGEYLILEVDNLAERRPSLIIGDKIIVHDAKNKLLHEGFIHKVCANHVYLKFSQKFHDIYNNEDYPITAEVSRGVLRKMHYAVNVAIRKLGREFLFPSKIITKNPQVEFVYDKYYDDLSQEENTSNSITSGDEDGKQISSEDELATEKAVVKLPKMSTTRLINLLKKNEELQRKSKGLTLGETNDGLLKLKWVNNNLNYYQKEAVRNILLGEARPLPYIIFGPPGTGKTITLIETILQIMLMMPHSRILVATPSNSASDLITTRLINSKLLKPGDLIRLVAQRLVLENNIPIHLIPYSGTINIGTEGTTRKSEVLKNGLRLGCDSSVIGLHRITVGTCATLGALMQHNMPKGHFTHIIVDEAGQATEPEIMIPLSLLDISNGQVILAGDPMQLGPVINSDIAIHYGLQESFLERFLTRFPYVRDTEGFKNTGGFDPRLVTKLLYNYRCLPNALESYNKLFYNSELKATISARYSPEATLLNGIKNILPNPNLDSDLDLPSVIFHGVIGENYRTPDSPSWFNPDEASYVFDYVNSLYKMGLTHKDIGIITPYIKQVKYLRTLFLQAEFEYPKIGSVEEFQGQEYNVIIMSIVRSESKYISADTTFNLGFVTNPRRVNVALSRAKCLTIIIGNPYILSTDTIWKSIIDECKENRSYCGCEL